MLVAAEPCDNRDHLAVYFQMVTFMVCEYINKNISIYIYVSTLFSINVLEINS